MRKMYSENQIANIVNKGIEEGKISSLKKLNIYRAVLDSDFHTDRVLPFDDYQYASAFYDKEKSVIIIKIMGEFSATEDYQEPQGFVIDVDEEIYNKKVNFDTADIGFPIVYNTGRPGDINVFQFTTSVAETESPKFILYVNLEQYDLYSAFATIEIPLKD